MDRRERMFIAFLAGDLDQSAGREWDEHLLHCDRCWAAVREDRAGRAVVARLRDSAPPELADRVRFAVEVAARASGQCRPRRWVLAATGALVAAVTTVVALVWLGSAEPADPPMIAAVVRDAQSAPPASTVSGRVSAWPGNASGTPVPIGAPIGLVAGDARLQVQQYRVGGVEAAVITSDRPFPMPTGAQMLAGASGADMAWTATRGRVALYCPSRAVLIAAAVPPSDLPGLASHLPLP